ncbi:MAG: hypothetical protein COA66_07295 [Arcobacter sp.]|nr:MAG: hypothetical protein COA66_07295 [Arcobacter sp.]
MIDKDLLKNMTILYAEDEDSIQNGITETLSLFGIHVICAKNGQEGLSLFKAAKTKIDLILTDIKMPKMDGLLMVQKIREVDEFIPVVITTAHQETNLLMKAIDLGISSYVLKPIDIYKLKETLHKAIEPKILKEQLLEQNKKLNIEVQKNKENQKIMVTQSRFAAMGEMINMIAHQWRQPLASIGTAAFTLKYKILSDAFNLDLKEQRNEQSVFFKNKLDEIEFYVQNLTTTIEDFRNFYKSDKKVLNKTIDSAIHNCLKIMKKDLQASNIEVQLDLKSKNKLNIYENEIIHVFLNILKNAQEKLLEKENHKLILEICTKDIKNTVQIDIYDNGGYLDENIKDKIFEPYFSTKKEKNGTGIGLYMSKIIIENHHQGKLFVKNIREGVCFSIILPKKIHL